MRLFVEPTHAPLAPGAECVLPPGPARHAQVRRVQPGDVLTLFDGSGRDWPAEVLAVGRSEVRVRIGTAPVAVARELPVAVTVAVGMPANERMDTLIEKATELGVAVVQPLLCERAVLVLAGERAERKRVHWQAVAQAACEQCGRSRVPVIEPVRGLREWLVAARALDVMRRLLSLRDDATPWAAVPLPAEGGALIVLSGPEGGLAPGEEDAARAAGFAPVSLGPRVLRADTAPLVVLAHLGLAAESGLHNGL